ncbi:MAG: hypothetical protein ACJ72N_10520 [Labedaea sp.]
MVLGERRISLAVWVVVPLLFSAAVLGLTAFGGVLLGADWQVDLSSAVLGPAAAITGLLSANVDWPARWRRWGIGLGYPALVFVSGLVFADVTLPTSVAIAAGLPALVVIGVLIARERNRVVPIAYRVARPGATAPGRPA